MLLNPERIAHWLGELVRIPSINPEAGETRVPDHYLGEQRMADYLAEQFTALGGQVEQEMVLPGRPNVYGMFPGESDSWAVVDVHTDTVGVSQMSDPPFDGRVENGRVWGRGAVDTKASLALILTLLEARQSQGLKLKQNLLVVGTVSEEIGGHGAAAFAAWARRRQLPLAQLLVAEPTLCTPVHAHKGVMGMRFQVHGKAAHSSKPHLGLNAIVAAMHAIGALVEEHGRLQRTPAETPLGPATLAVTLIEGGNGHNIVPESCTFTINRRLIPGEEPEAVMDRLEKLVAAASPLPITRVQGAGIAAFYQAPDSPWIQALAEWTGNRPEVAPYGTNALAYQGLAEETVIFGPGSIEQAHGAVEWVAIDELVRAGAIYTRWLLGSNEA